MKIDLQQELNKDQLRQKLLPHTRKAFHLLPEMERPRILDIGCGSGVPTIELALLSGGQVTGIDSDTRAISQLNKKIERIGLADRVTASIRSITQMEFSDESFDIVWAEGSIYAVGFEKGLRDWRRLIKDRGFLVIHDEWKDKEKKLLCIPDCGYALLNTFTLSASLWWTEYFSHLENRIASLWSRLRNDTDTLKDLEKERKDVDWCKSRPVSGSSIYYIMQKS